MDTITADTSDYGLMRFFVRSTVDRMQTGHDPKMTAMFAFHFAGKLRDDIRPPVNIHALAERMRREDRLAVRCGWCGVPMVEGNTAKPESTGMCPACFAREMRAMDTAQAAQRQV